MIGRVALLITFKKAKPKPQSLSRSHIRDLCVMQKRTMNKILITLGLLVLPFIGFCDTLDYWHVYYNDSVIAKFTSVSPDLKIEIDRSKIKEGDTLTVKHGDDTPCFNCKFVLFVRDEKKRKLRITETNEFLGKLSFGIKDLIEFGDKNESKRYDFYYWEQNDSGDKPPMKLVLQVIFKEE